MTNTGDRSPGRGVSVRNPRPLDHAASRMVRACSTSSARVRPPIATTTSRRIWRSAPQGHRGQTPDAARGLVRHAPLGGAVGMAASVQCQV
jgi:hypothetical protein